MRFAMLEWYHHNVTTIALFATKLFHDKINQINYLKTQVTSRR